MIEPSVATVEEPQAADLYEEETEGTDEETGAE